MEIQTFSRENVAMQPLKERINLVTGANKVRLVRDIAP
jgi:hypothetical protein